MRLRRNIKFDFIIYSCLLGASSLLVFSAKSYCASLSEYNGFSSEIKNALKEIKGDSNKNDYSEEKPEVLSNINEKELIENYLYSILDDIKTDQNISKEMIKSWNNYEIINSEYIREITNTYYSFSFDVKIPNQNAILPTDKNEKLSTEDYIIISLIANISIKNDINQVKNIDIPT